MALSVEARKKKNFLEGRLASSSCWSSLKWKRFWRVKYLTYSFSLELPPALTLVQFLLQSNREKQRNRASQVALAVKIQTANAADSRDVVSSWVGEIPWRWKWQPVPVFLPEKLRGQGSLVGYSPWGHKEWDTTEHTHTEQRENGAVWWICSCFLLK